MPRIGTKVRNWFRRRQPDPWTTAHERYAPGDRVAGRVVSFTDHGAAIEIEPGLRGFLHAAETSWTSQPSHPSEFLSEGDRVETVVLKLNADEGRLRLGLRQLNDDPWETANERYAPGTRVRGKVLSLSDERAFVEVESGVEGILHRSDMSWGRRSCPAEVCPIGDSVETVVLTLDPKNRRLRLGIKQLTEDPWITAGERYPAGTIVSGTVVNLTDYGAFIEVEPGVEGLLHQSEMSWSTRWMDPSEVLTRGASLEVAVLGCDPAKRRLALGLRQLTEDPWKTAPERYPVGTRVRGQVVGLSRHGAFVEVERDFVGFVHIRDLSWKRVHHPSEVLGIGDSVDIAVLGVDTDKRRLTLGRKQVEEDPWVTVHERYAVGDRIRGTVTNLADYGAFIEIEPGVDGLLHKSEMSPGSLGGEGVPAVPSEGDSLDVIVLRINSQRRRIALGQQRGSGSPGRSTVPSFEAELTENRFRARWVLASAVGMAVAAAVARPLSYLVGGAAHEALGFVFGEAVVGVVAGGGTLGGGSLAQWLLLRGRVAWAARWPAAGAAGGAAGAAAGFAALAGLTLLGAEALGGAAGLVVGVAAFVRAYSRVLGRGVPRAGWLAAACAAGFVGAALVTMAVGWLSGFDGESPAFAALFGGLYGTATLWALSRWSRTDA